MNFTDLIPLYDYTLWEQGIQSFFADPVQGGGLFMAPPENDDVNREQWTAPKGVVTFFTAFQNAVFQKARPRVSLAPVSYTPLNERALVLDANGRLQNRAFTVPLEFTVTTQADYKYHTQMLATVRAIISQMNPVLAPAGVPSGTDIQTTGLNAFLTIHELAKIWDPGNSLNTGITLDKGAYVTPIRYQATFAVRAAAWPGGQQNA